MNDQEKFFFLVCYALRGFVKPWDVYRIFRNVLPPKRAVYYLNKWERKGFYGDGVSEWSGRFYPSKLPSQYKALLEKVYPIPIESYQSDYFSSSLIAGCLLPDIGEEPDLKYINNRRHQLDGRAKCKMCGQMPPRKCLFCDHYFPFDRESGGCGATLQKTLKDATCGMFAYQNNWTFSWRQFPRVKKP